MRNPDLQHLFDLAEAAYMTSQNRDGEAHRAATLAFDRLRASTGPASTETQAILPVCNHLSAALEQVHPARQAVADALVPLLPHLVWRRRVSADLSNPDFYHGHANAMLAGPGGIEARDDLMFGMTLIAPGVLYPDHTHPPEEVYLALTPGEWWNARMDWTDPGPDGLIYNPPGIMHAMRAGAGQAFLALWVLPY